MWRYRVDDNQVIDADTGKALTLEEVTKLLNAIPGVKEECKQALDLVDKALDKLKDVDIEDGLCEIAINTAINLLEQASKPLDNLGWADD